MGERSSGRSRHGKKGGAKNDKNRNRQSLKNSKDGSDGTPPTDRWKYLAFLIPIAAIFVSLRSQDYEVGDSVDLFWANLCRRAGCHSALIPDGRTMKVSKDLPAGSLLLDVPDSFTLWDLDAMRDPKIQNQLFFPVSTQRKKRSGACYLSVYLARLWKQARKGEPLAVSSSFAPLLNAWLKILPTYDDFVLFHPLLWRESELKDRLGEYSTAYEYVKIWLMMFEAEYVEFAENSNDFAQDVSLEEYLESRLIVGTRAALVRHDDSGRVPNSEELVRYKQDAAVDFFEHGYHILVPGFDMINHESSTGDVNAFYRYHWESKSFQTFVAKEPHMPAGTHATISYGSEKTDSDLLARYGFVTGDGHHPIDVSLAVHHHVLLSGQHFARGENIKGTLQFVESLAKYLQYDDGHSECVIPRASHDEKQNAEWNLKIQKFKFLHPRSSLPEFWFVLLSPRRLDTNSSKDELPPQFNLESQMNSLSHPISSEQSQKLHRGIVSTCRVLSLVPDDFDGKALSMLKERSTKRDFYLEPDGDDGANNLALEYRTWKCVHRLASDSMSRYPLTLQKQFDLVGSLDRQKFNRQGSSSSDHPWKWTMEHVRLGEMQALEVVTSLAESKMQIIEKSHAEHEMSQTVFKVREQPCTEVHNYAQVLFDLVPT